MSPGGASPRRALLAVTLAALAVGACRDAPKTALSLVIDLPPGVQADELHVDAAVDGQPLLTADLPKKIAGPIAAKSDFVLLMADSLAFHDVSFAIDALYQSALVAHGDTSIAPTLHKTLKTTVHFYAATPCPTGQANCAGTCTEVTSDRLHCGRCDVACAAGEVCRTSSCEHNPCGDGQHECSGTCYPDTDVLHCGPSCIACPVPAAHGAAACVDDQCELDCESGYVQCPGACVDLNSDPDNCGTCGHECTSPQACISSNCAANPCGSGYHYCSGCVSNYDVANCGTSSCSPCPAQNGTATCDGVSCGITCDTSYHECSGACVTNASVDHCGQSCGACPAPTNGTATCNGTSCGVTCTGGYKPCGSECIPNADTCSNWQQVTLSTHPSARALAAMAYDSQRHVVVLFGGWNGATDLDETWEFNGTAWSQKTPTNKPTARDSAAMAYDPIRQKVVLFGGYTSQAEADTWLWDGTNWTSPPTVGVPPAARYGAAATWDGVGSVGSVVIFGGGNPTPALFNDVWSWNGTQWNQYAPPTGTPPSGRQHAGMIRDGTQMVIFGGGSDWNTTTPYGDMFALTLAAWSPITVARPSARGAMGFALNSTAGNGLLFGGMTGQASAVGETWSWAGGAWTRLTPTTEPSARGGVSMAYDAQRQVMVLFGGDNGTSYLDETWEFVE